MLIRVRTKSTAPPPGWHAQSSPQEYTYFPPLSVPLYFLIHCCLRFCPRACFSSFRCWSSSGSISSVTINVGPLPFIIRFGHTQWVIAWRLKRCDRYDFRKLQKCIKLAYRWKMKYSNGTHCWLLACWILFEVSCGRMEIHLFKTSFVGWDTFWFSSNCYEGNAHSNKTSFSTVSLIWMKYCSERMLIDTC